MRKKLTFLSLILITSLFMAIYVTNVQAVATPTKAPAKPGAPVLAAPACSGFTGTFKATNWPGGKLTVTCPGKNRRRGDCVGASKQLSPGEKFSFNNCNCLDPKGKCLTISKLPPGCKMSGKLACASNREVVDSAITVNCTGAGASGAAGSGTPTISPGISGTTGTGTPGIGTTSITPEPTEIPEVVPSYTCVYTQDGTCVTPSGGTTIQPTP